MIDNFEQIKTLLEFKSEDDFYFGQIIMRKKDNPNTTGSNNNARLIKAYYIKSIKQLENLKEEMVTLANLYNARVCLNLNRRSFEKTAFLTLRKISNQIMDKDFKSVRRAYNSACGEYLGTDKKWLLDFDTKDESFVSLLKNLLENIEPIGEKILAKIPSKTGYHLITCPFNVSRFNYFFNSWNDILKPEIHKNNPVNLYIP
jgi:hypothetical protein